MRQILMTEQRTSTYLFGGTSFDFGRELDFTRRPFGQDESPFLRTISDGTIELIKVGPAGIKFVFIFSELMVGEQMNVERSGQGITFLIVARETPWRASSEFATMHS